MCAHTPTWRALRESDSHATRTHSLVDSIWKEDRMKPNLYNICFYKCFDEYLTAVKPWGVFRKVIFYCQEWTGCFKRL